ncbi:MAG: S8 family peptidase [Halanaerobiaceae bacterium]
MFESHKLKLTKILFIISMVIILSSCSNNKLDSEKHIIQGTLDLPEIIPESYNLSENNIANNKININSIETAHHTPREYIIKLVEPMEKNSLKNILQDQGKILNKISENMYKIKINNENNKLISSLQENPVIEYIEPEYLVHIQNIPDDPLYKKQWNLQMLNMESTWKNIQGGSDVIVAVLDTGILKNHPDLNENIVDGYDFVDHDFDPTDTDPEFSHGSHVAGIIAATANNGQGISGLARNIKIMPVRVIDSGGSGGYSNLIAGIHWAVDNGADIINLSLAGNRNSRSLRDAVKYAVNRGTTIIASAGNNGSSPILYPAKYPEVISVGAVGPTAERAYYSNYGPDLDLVAPGGDSYKNEKYNTIISTSGSYKNNRENHQYIWSQGTSMAAPHVTAIAALLYSQNINKPEQIKKLLKESADDLGKPGHDDEYGAGLVNVNKALNFDTNNNEFNSKTKQVTDDKSQIKILAWNDKGEQITSNTHINNPVFSMALNKGRWTIKAESEDYHGQVNIIVPEDKNIKITLK